MYRQIYSQSKNLFVIRHIWEALHALVGPACSPSELVIPCRPKTGIGIAAAEEAMAATTIALKKCMVLVRSGGFGVWVIGERVLEMVLEQVKFAC